MKAKKTRYHAASKKDDKFETEALSFLNPDDGDDKTKNKHDRHKDSDSDDDQELVEHSDAEADLVNADDVSDDEAPDDVGFHDSKQSIMTQLRSALKQVDADKKTKKEQRRKLDAQFKEQKAKKNEELSKAKLSADFFDDLPEAVPSKKAKVSTKRCDSNESEASSDHDTESTDERTVQQKKNNHTILSEDFIEFSDSGVQVAALQTTDKESKSVAQTAADFRNNRLYGKNIRRESNQSRLAKAEKRRYLHVGKIVS